MFKTFAAIRLAIKLLLLQEKEKFIRIARLGKTEGTSVSEVKQLTIGKNEMHKKEVDE